MNPGSAFMECELDLERFRRGKVRDNFVLDDKHLLMVCSDRVSAYDHVLPNGIPDRGRVLTQLSIWWFMHTDHIQPNHLVSGMMPDLPEPLRRPELSGRFMIVRKTKRIDIECVVRGYLAGSAWSEYEQSGTLAGEKLPDGLVESQRLPTPIFSPATKEESGHDQNITFAQVQELVGDSLAARLRDASLALYEFAAEAVAAKGLILADTKFEFGLIGDALILIDEALTPDSSRYWDAASYLPGTTPPSYDKQIVRDWLDRQGWDHSSPPPALPDDIVERTRDRYLHAYQTVTGHTLFHKERV